MPEIKSDNKSSLNMQQLTNEDLRIIFYTHYESKVYYKSAIQNSKWMEFSNDHLSNILKLLRNNEFEIFDNHGYKIGLIPLDKLTDQHKIDLCKIAGYFSGLDETHYIKTGGELISNYIASSRCNVRGIDWFAVFQFLVKNQYAVPLWFGIDHWANGKTAIELGLAIKKTNK